jgi:hypothetical protein
MSMLGQRTAVPRGGFTRSAGAAAGRGVLLIVFALALGILLLARAIDGTNTKASTSPPTGRVATPTTAAAAPAAPSGPTAATNPATTLPPAHEPAQVAVLVLNGREVQGVARANNDVLLRVGYNGLAPGNTSAAVAATSVYFTDPAFQADAAKVAEALTIPADKVVALGPTNLNVDLKAAKVVVLLGQDGLGAKPS